MTMPLYQNDPRLKKEPSLAPFGCLVTTLREILERRYKRCITPETWLVTYRHMVQLGIVRDDSELRAFVMNHERVLKSVAEVLDVESPCRYVLRQSIEGSNQHDFDHEIKPNAWIAQARIEGARHSHFYEVFQDGDCAWDPLWPTRKKVKTISLRGYVI